MITAKRIALMQITARVDRAWVQLRFQESTGFVSIASDYGHWTYHWMPGHRHDSLGHFLARIDQDYAGGKFLGSGLNQASPEATSGHVKRWILENRRNCSLNKSDARKHWEDLALLVDEDIDGWLRETTIYDAWDMVCTEMVPSWVHFWEKLWVPKVRAELFNWPENKAEAALYELTLTEGPKETTWSTRRS